MKANKGMRGFVRLARLDFPRISPLAINGERLNPHVTRCPATLHTLGDKPRLARPVFDVCADRFHAKSFS